MDIHTYKGLTSHEVKQRFDKGQVNISQDNISKSKKQIVLEHTLTYFNILNVCLAIIIISTGRWTNLTFMFAVIINAIVGIYQEIKVKKVIDQLTVVTVTKVKTIRDGVLTEIPVEELVLDDIIFLESGNQIGTDCIVLKSMGMEVNEAMLTGESQPVKKSNDDELLSGSFVVAGSGYAKVTRVGNDNYSTQLVHKAKHKNKASSEMKNAIEKVIKILSFVIVPVGIVLFLSQLTATPYDRSTAIVKTVAGIIGMIPEGLVLLTSLSFIIGVGKLARKNALIQEMEAIEALARINVLCLDKTGTITTGELAVENVQILTSTPKNQINDIIGAMAYGFQNVNATQMALQNYFHKPDDYCPVDFIPFSSQRKMEAMSFQGKGHYVLGAPEYLMDIDNPLLQQVENYSNQGLRVLLLGQTTFIDYETSQIGPMTPLAFIVLRDCIKDDAKDTLAFFERQGVDIRILSGDNPLTVSKVAQLAGLKNGDRYIDASLLPTDMKDIQKVVKHYQVFGRVKPEQKHLIIKALQNEGLIVGMVGDGVNDVLAIKDADCGVAMANGSDAAKQAAHIVLLDSRFASMKQIVKEGKTIIANIERVSSLYLTKTIYSTIFCLIFAGFRLSYPFTPIQLSLISGLAIGVPSFFLTLEQSSGEVSQGFLKHVISTAVPCALTMITYVCAITIMGSLLKFDNMMYSTYYYLTAGFISFLVVFVVCQPLSRLRTIMVSIVTIIFYLILFILPNLFGIYRFLDMRLIWLLPICLSAVFIMQFYMKSIRYCYIAYRQVKHHKASKEKEV